MAKPRDVAAYVNESRLTIQKAFAALPIFKRTREQALYHYCAVLEVEAYKTEASQKKHFSAGRAAVESSIRAVPALFERCAPGDTDPRIDQVLFSEAHDLFVFSQAYEEVEYSLALADKGQFEIHGAAIAKAVEAELPELRGQERQPSAATASTANPRP